MQTKNAIEISEKELCAHCGEPCEDERIEHASHQFCCYGCKAVYELLEDSDLHGYYDNDQLKLNAIPDQGAISRKYQSLDLEEVSRQYIQYTDEALSVAKFYLPGIHCSSCIYLLEHLPRLYNQVIAAEVNFIRKEVVITFQHAELSLKELAVVLAGLGYPPSVSLGDMNDQQKKKQMSPLGIQIAVAGFCFGNSMLISMPEYLDSRLQLGSELIALFGWINLLLSVPVVFYAAKDYFISSWKALRHGHLNIDLPISIGVFTLFARSGYEILWSAGAGYVDSLTGLVFFLLLGKWYQSKTYQALSFDRDYTSYFPISVVRVRQGVEENTMLKDLKPGDVIQVHNYELIPADGEILEGEARLDYSFVTGESRPAVKKAGDQVFAGARQIGGQLLIKLHKEVSNSELTRLWNKQTEEKNHSKKYSLLLDKVSKYFTLAVLAIAVCTGTYWQLVNPAIVWDAVTAVLIVACPCALALALPFAFGHAMRIFGQNGVYLKNANVIEAVSRVRKLVFDKTGTLTTSDPMTLSYEGVSLSGVEAEIVKTIAANSAHPLSRMITNYFDDSVEKKPLENFREELGKGLEANVNGQQIRLGSAEWVGVPITRGNGVKVHVKVADQYKGYFSMNIAYREGIFEALSTLREQYDLHLLSGDQPTERQLLASYFDRLSFDQKPTDKYDYVSGLGAGALMIGDGLNDAGALNAGDVGFAVSEDIHQFSPACDAIISGTAVTSISQILRFSSRVMQVIKGALLIAFLYNIVGLSFAVSGNLSPIVSAILMPISSVSVVLFITLAVNAFGKRLQKQECQDS